MDIVVYDSHNPIKILRDSQNVPLEHFSVLVSLNEIDELKEYVKEVVHDPSIIRNKSKKLLLLYIAAIRFLVLSLEELNEEDITLLDDCDNLAKTLYIFYSDIKVMLIAKEIKNQWKSYLKLRRQAKLIPEYSMRKIESGCDRILFSLAQLNTRIKTI